MDAAIECDVDSLPQKTYWVIDCLPSQVPADAEGQFFAVEPLLLEGQRGAELRRRFASVLLMANCYHDLVVFRGEDTRGKTNPRPEKREKWVMRNREQITIVARRGNG